MHTTKSLIGICIFLTCMIGCSRGPSRIKPPDVDPESAADAAIELYDSDKNGALSATELEKCPGILAELKKYDSDANGAVSRDEIVFRISALRRHSVGLTRLNCDVKLNGRGISNAAIEFEPEPYLGEEVKTARGTTNERGVAQMAIPSEELPEDQRDLKAVHYGTYKVRITHPTIELPPKYNTETTLGYESRPGDPYAAFVLTTK